MSLAPTSQDNSDMEMVQQIQRDLKEQTEHALNRISKEMDEFSVHQTKAHTSFSNFFHLDPNHQVAPFAHHQPSVIPVTASSTPIPHPQPHDVCDLSNTSFPHSQLNISLELSQLDDFENGINEPSFRSQSAPPFKEHEKKEFNIDSNGINYEDENVIQNILNMVQHISSFEENEKELMNSYKSPTLLESAHTKKESYFENLNETGKTELEDTVTNKTRGKFINSLSPIQDMSTIQQQQDVSKQQENIERIIEDNKKANKSKLTEELFSKDKYNNNSYSVSAPKSDMGTMSANESRATASLSKEAKDLVKRMFNIDSIDPAFDFDSTEKGNEKAETTLPSKLPSPQKISKFMDMESSSKSNFGIPSDTESSSFRPLEQPESRRYRDFAKVLKDQTSDNISNSSISRDVQEAERFNQLITETIPLKEIERQEQLLQGKQRSPNSCPSRQSDKKDSEPSFHDETTHPSMYHFNVRSQTSKFPESMIWQDVSNHEDSGSTPSELFRFNARSSPDTTILRKGEKEKSVHKEESKTTIVDDNAKWEDPTDNILSRHLPEVDRNEERILSLDEVLSANESVASQKNMAETEDNGILQFLNERISSLEKEKDKACKKITELETTNRKYKQQLNKPQEKEGSGKRDDSKNLTEPPSKENSVKSFNGDDGEEVQNATILSKRSKERLDYLRMQNEIANLEYKNSLLERQLEYSQFLSNSLKEERDDAVFKLTESQREIQHLRQQLRHAESASHGIFPSSDHVLHPRKSPIETKNDENHTMEKSLEEAKKKHKQAEDPRPFGNVTSSSPKNSMARNISSTILSDIEPIEEPRSKQKKESDDDIKQLKNEVLNDRLLRALMKRKHLLKKKPTTSLVNGHHPKYTVSLPSPEKPPEREVRTPQWEVVEDKPRRMKSVPNTKATTAKTQAVPRSNSFPQNPKSISKGREMPFIIGTNTGKSHSLTANLQRVYSLLKSHNSVSCSLCDHRRRSKSDPQSGTKAECKHSDLETEDTEEAIPSKGRVKRVVRLLEDEFRHLKMTYQTMLDKYTLIDPADDENAVETLSQLSEDIRDLVHLMEIKSDQITTLRDFLKSDAQVIDAMAHQTKNSMKIRKSTTNKTVGNRSLLRGSQRIQQAIKESLGKVP